MLFQRSLLLGVSAGLLSTLACIVYSYFIWTDWLYTDFSPLVSWWGLLGACMFGCVLAGIGHWAAVRVLPKYGEFVFNMLFALFSFASLIGPIGYTWPTDVSDDIMLLTDSFAYYAMPMHLFPVVVWFGLRPLFFKTVVNR
jgi:hypothetical protein